MSEVAGRMAAQIGAQFLEKTKDGKGILLGGVPGVKRGKWPLSVVELLGLTLQRLLLGWVLRLQLLTLACLTFVNSMIFSDHKLIH
jgi:alanine dehydrogenase